MCSCVLTKYTKETYKLAFYSRITILTGLQCVKTDLHKPHPALCKYSLTMTIFINEDQFSHHKLPLKPKADIQVQCAKTLILYYSCQ